MMNDLISANYKSTYLNSLANNFDNQTKYQGDFVLPNIKENNTADRLQKSVDVLKNSPQIQSKKTNWGYLSGVAATLGQVVGGLLMIPAAFMEKSETTKTKTEIKILLPGIQEEIDKEVGKLKPNLSKKKKLKLEKELEEELINKRIKNLPKEAQKKIKEKIENIIKETGKSSIERFGNWLNKKGKCKNFAEKIINNGKNLHGLGMKFNRIGWVSLGLSYFTGSTCIGCCS